MDNELERMWQLAVVPQFDVLSQHFLWLRYTTKNFMQGSGSLGLDLDPGSPKQEF
jgi:hypothetical protein